MNRMTITSAARERRRRVTASASADDSRDVCEVGCTDERKVARTRRAMPSPTSVGTLAETFPVLGDPTRLRIAHALSGEELCCCDFANVLAVPPKVVSHSLRALRQMRLVRHRKEEKLAYYAPDDERIASLLAQRVQHVVER